jgi:calcineurin-like phosphoesterase family protein
MSTFLTSDLHLDHTNIIRYCQRPFRDKFHMNEVLINNWNNTIRPKDKVYFLGDLSFQSEQWIPYLNGDIVFIKGNHDYFKHTQYYKNSVLKYKGYLFYLVHDPKDIPMTWTGYSICGHNHHTRPFFNSYTKIFNVSTDVTGFYPININYIIDICNKDRNNESLI